MDPKDLKPGQSIQEMGGSQPDCSRELKTGQCIGDLRKDEPARPARKHPSEMQPGEIKRHYQKLSEKSSKLVDKLIEAGFGSVKSSEMRERRSEHPLFEAYVSNLDQMGELKAEAERRYGPGLASVSHLSRIHGPLKKAGDLDKGDLVDLKTKKVLSTTPTASTPKETQPLVEDGKKKIVNRQYLRDNFKPTKPNRTKLEGDDKQPNVKKTEQLKKQLSERIDLLKAKIIDLKSRKTIATLPYEPTPQRGEIGPQGNLQPKPQIRHEGEEKIATDDGRPILGVGGPLAPAARSVMGRIESARPAEQTKAMFKDKGPNAVKTPAAKAKARAQRNTRFIKTPDGEHKRYFQFQRENGAIPGKKGDKVHGTPMAPGHKLFGIPAKEPGVHGHTSVGDKSSGGSRDAELRGRSAAGINAEYGTRRMRETGQDDFGSVARAKELHVKKLMELRAMPDPKLTKTTPKK
jgi:hypothetical protein